MPSSGGCERVVPRTAIVLRDAPLRLDQALALEAIEGGVERALAELKNLLRPLLEAFGNAPAMHRLELHRAEHEHVERALQDIFSGSEAFGIAHHGSFRLSEGEYGGSFRASRERSGGPRRCEALSEGRPLTRDTPAEDSPA